MGNIKSFCCKDTASDIDDREERSRILNDNASSNGSYNPHSLDLAQDSLSYGSINNGLDGRTMEQSVLDKIYQKMASNVIDVAPGESMVIQPAEFMERQKAYQAKLNQIKTPLPLKSSASSRVAKHVNTPSLDTQRHNATTISTTACPSSLVPNVSNLGPGSVLSAANCSANLVAQNVNKSQEKRRVEYEPISAEEIQLINDISERSHQAVMGLKISSDEQVVIQFQP